MNDQTTNACTIRLAGRRFDTTRKGERIAGKLYCLWLRLRRWQIETRAIRHLESLEDHRLEDIGIERSEIAAAVHGSLEQREALSRSGTACRASRCRRRLAA